MSDLKEQTLLGKEVAYPDHYAPGILTPVARIRGVDGQAVASFGEDIWNAWELSWLTESGKPRMAWAEIRVPAESKHLVESKSLKLYLNSLNGSTFESVETLQQCIQTDLSQVAGASVRVRLESAAMPTAVPERAGELALALAEHHGWSVGDWDYHFLDDLEPGEVPGEPDLATLQPVSGRQTRNVLHTDLLRSNCPVTGQPDWASLWLAYAGPEISPESLLAYVLAYRNQQDFHERCAEKIFSHLYSAYQPAGLTVYARYTRRGGLDINPWRSSVEGAAPNIRMMRQ